jgi:hypothetical protein
MEAVFSNRPLGQGKMDSMEARAAKTRQPGHEGGTEKKAEVENANGPITVRTRGCYESDRPEIVSLRGRMEAVLSRPTQGLKKRDVIRSRNLKTDRHRNHRNQEQLEEKDERK